MIDRQKYIEKLLALPTARLVSGKRQILMRCRYCPDSKDPTHAHMYINIPSSESEPLQFHCVKCNMGGYVTPARIMAWGIYDPELLVEIAKHNKNPNIQRAVISDAMVYNLYNPIPICDDLNLRKLDYINNRLGLSLTLEDMVRNRIILSITQFLDANRIQKATRDFRIIRQFEYNFLGFLSFDNAFINLRNLDFMKVHESIADRYTNYNIFDKRDNSMKFFVRPNDHIDTLKKVRVNIAEGPFDILSVRHNLIGKDNDANQLDCAVTGSGYFSVLRFVLLYLKIYNIELHIYKDNDMDWSFMEKIADFLTPYGIDFYVHINTMPGQKDMGVDLSKIKEEIYPMRGAYYAKN